MEKIIGTEITREGKITMQTQGIPEEEKGQMRNNDVGEGMKYCNKHFCWYPIGSGCPKCNQSVEMEVKK